MQETATESGQRLRVIETALALLLVLLLIAATFRVSDACKVALANAAAGDD